MLVDTLRAAANNITKGETSITNFVCETAASAAKQVSSWIYSYF